LTLALDTSVAVPLLVQTHAAHHDVVRWWGRRPVALSGHALAETYAVLTRLPGDLRVAPVDAARLLTDRFDSPYLLGPEASAGVPEVLSGLGVSGGAVYDALVALAAHENGVDLATRDLRAKATYDLVGVRVVIAA
jgi:predicted nucleic acid-binding protein